MKTLKKPLTQRALKRRADKDGRLSVNIVVDLDDLIGFGDIDSLNNLADERILDQDTISGSLSDIAYKVVGSIPGKGDGTATGSVIINVNADVSDIISEDA
jgi:hypothetical protein